jgi:serine protease Do
VVGRSVTASAAKKLGLARPGGVEVEEVAARSPAAEAGVKPGDVVLGVEGKPIEDENALRFRFATLRIGATVRLGLWRGGETRQLEIRLTAPPESPARSVTQLKVPVALTGATVASLSPALAEELQADPVPGVIVLDVPRASPAAKLGLAVGDIVQSVDGQPVTTVAELQQARGTHLALRRDGRVLRLPRE